MITTAPDLSTDPDACYKVLASHDARFDGRFFVGVKSTGVYCRPVCRVRLPRQENCRFFGHAALAESAGFRPCLRCRPELAPQGATSLRWSMADAAQTLTQQALRLMDEPAAWGDEGPTPERLAERLGVSSRHLRRIFEAQLGVSPLQVLQTRRLLAAKQLLTDTQLDMAQIAYASGFGSVRRFNAAFVAHYRLQPTAIRRDHAKLEKTEGRAPGDRNADTSPPVRVRLAYRPPYDVTAMLVFLQQRSIPLIETIDPARRRVARSLRVSTGCGSPADSAHGVVCVEFDPALPIVHLQASDSLALALPALIRRVRHWLDLDADPLAIHSTLSGPFPQGEGLRVPGALDGFELAVRAVLGQQVTVAAARTFAERLVKRFGEPLDVQTAILGRELTHLFPSPAVLARASADSLGELGIVRTRQAAIVALAQAMDSGQLALHAGADVQATMAHLRALPGIGDWTAQYIAMRALRWPDAFPAGDVALHKALDLPRPWGTPKATRAAEAASQAWRPWRSYAVLRAWSTLNSK